MAISAALLGHAGPTTGRDWELFLLWQGFIVVVHSACLIVRLWHGRPLLPTGAIAKVVVMCLTQCASEPLDAFRDPIVATAFLQSGLPVGYLAAPLALLAVASSTTPKEAFMW